ncbi:MAG: DNA-processing protein DprA [Lentisphaeria bacterium]|nr:DNA-processing protein DprA [Lentisphaeria bacterium]
MTERELCIALNMISGVGHARYRALLDFFGSPENIRNASRGELLRIPGIGRVLAERIIAFDWDSELSREMAVAERGDVRIVTLADKDYPAELRDLFDPPLCLYIRGKLPENFERSIAVVGSRRISRYGKETAEMFAGEAVECGFTVYSGLAAGIDTVAHRTVTENKGRTVGVLGAGLMHMYPQENIALAREIIANGGAVISEFPLNYPISRHNFPRRNRIVAAMSRATLVVEAGLESGALITAHQAAELGRDVFAVPGRLDNSQAKGCHQLIKEGAGLVENFDDILIALHLGGRSLELGGGASGEVQAVELPPDCIEIYHHLQQGEADLERLQELTGKEPGELLAILMKLELKMLVERDSDHFYRLCGMPKKRKK